MAYSSDTNIIEITNTQIIEVIEGHYVINGVQTVAPTTPTTFEFYQSVASDSWAIVHNLNKFPSVTIVDSSGREVDGQVTHLNNKSLLCEFTQPFAGRAFLN